MQVESNRIFLRLDRTLHSMCKQLPPQLHIVKLQVVVRYFFTGTIIVIIYFVYQVSCHEEIEWLPVDDSTHHLPELDELKSWMGMGQKKIDISDEKEFVDPRILDAILSVRLV